jgi:hypothetical protein
MLTSNYLSRSQALIALGVVTGSLAIIGALSTACSGTPAVIEPPDAQQTSDAATELDAEPEADGGPVDKCECSVQSAAGAVSTIACAQTKCVDGRSYQCSSAEVLTRGGACGIVDAGSDVSALDASIDGAGPCVAPDQATQLFKDLPIGRASRVAIDGTDIYFVWTVLGAGNAAIYKAPSAGGASILVKTLGTREGLNHGLTVQQGVVYYTDKSSSAGTRIDTLYKITSVGAAPQIVHNIPVPAGGTRAIGSSLESNSARLYAAFDRGGNIAPTKAGVLNIRLSDGQAATIPATAQPAFTTSVLAFDKSGYLAVYQESTVGAGSDRKIRVYDPARNFAQVAVTPAATRLSTLWQHAMALEGNTLAWLDESGANRTLTACTLPNCVPAPVSFAAQVRPFTIASANGRLYFESVVTDKCAKANIAFQSCAWSTVAAGTCTPQTHATSFNLLGAKDMVVGPNFAILTTQEGDTFRVTL